MPSVSADKMMYYLHIFLPTVGWVWLHEHKQPDGTRQTYTNDISEAIALSGVEIEAFVRDGYLTGITWHAHKTDEFNKHLRVPVQMRKFIGVV